MKCEIIINKTHEEKIIIYAKEKSQLIEDIKHLAETDDFEIIGYKNKDITVLNPSDIYCITVIDNKVFAICENQNFMLKKRLYLLEERLPSNFIKINQSCIANLHKIERFDAAVSGTLKLHFKNGYTDFVSRRQLKHIKERIGI